MPTKVGIYQSQAASVDPRHAWMDPRELYSFGLFAWTSANPPLIVMGRFQFR
ncbi:hypothetical protein SAMN05518671_3857 [Stenotrophomonas lactitubi]|nr:hypothetical protein SAMN04487863_0057 [Stenotrophomonas sp. yr243]SNT59028.1 hypothetical protein SAMN05518671_3857 [Stenotrophomonas lactitubi]